MAAPPPPVAAAAAQAPPAAGGQKFSLGAAAFGGQPDAASAHPDEQAPLAWQRLLVQLADPPAWRGLFASCRGGRDLVLQHTPQVTLTLPLLLDQPLERWIEQHVQLKSALTMRGRLPTHLRLEEWDEREQPEVQGTPLPMGLLSLLLQPTTAAGITKAVLQSICQQHPQPSAVTQVLAALPSLKCLQLTSAHPITLPAPAALPRLRDLTIDLYSLSDIGADTYQTIFGNAAQFVPHLSSLQILGHRNSMPLPAVYLPLFTSAPHLNTLVLSSAPLTSRLLRLLLQQAPALEQLRVHYVHRLSAQERHRVWGLKTLTVSILTPGIANVPACRAGKLRWQARQGGCLQLPCESSEVSVLRPANSCVCVATTATLAHRALYVRAPMKCLRP